MSEKAEQIVRRAYQFAEDKDIEVGRLGEWAELRVLTVQFRDIGSSDISELAKPEARIVAAPANYSSGDLVPYRPASAPR
jgi:hypothetical protein